jgi:hypothetical protein
LNFKKNYKRRFTMITNDMNGIYGATNSDPSIHPAGIIGNGVLPVEMTTGINPYGAIKGSTAGVAIAAGNVGQLITGIYLVNYAGDGLMADTTVRCIHALALVSGSATLTRLGPQEGSILGTDGTVGTSMGFSTLYYVVVTASCVLKVTGSTSGGDITGARIVSGAAIRIA